MLKPSKHLANVMNFIRDLSRWLKIFFMNSSLPSTSIPVARYTFSNSSLSSRLLIPKTSSCTFFEAYKTPQKLVQVTNLQPGGYSTPDPTLLYIYWTSSEAAITQIQLLVNLVARTLISQIQWSPKHLNLRYFTLDISNTWISRCFQPVPSSSR